MTTACMVEENDFRRGNKEFALFLEARVTLLGSWLHRLVNLRIAQATLVLIVFVVLAAWVGVVFFLDGDIDSQP